MKKDDKFDGAIMHDPFSTRIKALIFNIPKGKVATYGYIAAMAGNPRGARQVARILHSSSRKNGLPWHRVVNRNGQISLKPFQGYELQRQLIEKEGIVFDEKDSIDLDRYLWRPDPGIIDRCLILMA